MVVDVVLRDGTTTQRRRLVTTDVVDIPLDVLVRSTVDLATRLMNRTAVGEYLRAMRSYLGSSM
jgi:hypothetical protein